MQYSVKLGSQTVVCELERKAVKNINIRVRPDGTVYVSANSRVPLSEIERVISSHAALILRAVERCERRAEASKAKRFVDGDKLTIFGTEKLLYVKLGKTNSVAETAKEVILTVKDANDTELKKRVLSEWLHVRCAQTVTALCKMINPVFSRYGVSFPQIKFRQMRSRWGSCAPAKHIVTFNYALVAAPIQCVEYVAAHEFCHFLHPDHSPAFHACLTAVMPDWKQRKKLLNDVVSDI